MQVGDATREVQQQRADELKKLVELYNMCSGSDAKSVEYVLFCYGTISNNTGIFEFEMFNMRYK